MKFFFNFSSLMNDDTQQKVKVLGCRGEVQSAIV